MEIFQTRLKVLAIAYACNPFKGSEHGVGWGWVKMLAESNEVFVIAAEFEKDDIQRWISQHPGYKGRMHFFFPRHRPWHYHNLSNLWLKIENSPFKIVMNMAYRMWQIDAFRLAQKLYKNIHFSLCHLITYVGFRFPGKFFILDCPFVWGPIGGLENTPRHFLPLMGAYGATYYSVRNLINDFDRRFLTCTKGAMNKAAQCNGLIAATSGIQKEIRRWYGVESTVICEIVPPPVTIVEPIVERKSSELLRICWSGEHLPGKALQLLLRALATLSCDVNWRLDVLGFGPCTRKWKDESEALGIGADCTFHGHLSRKDALFLMQKAHLFVITSLKDLTSTVLLEALSFGKPVIAPDHCGFSDILDENCGVKIKIENLDRFISQIATQIEILFRDEALRLRLSHGALARAKDFSWENKAEVLNEIYRRAISGRLK